MKSLTTYNFWTSTKNKKATKIVSLHIIQCRWRLETVRHYAASYGFYGRAKLGLLHYNSMPFGEIHNSTYTYVGKLTLLSHGAISISPIRVALWQNRQNRQNRGVIGKQGTTPLGMSCARRSSTAGRKTAPVHIPLDHQDSRGIPQKEPLMKEAPEFVKHVHRTKRIAHLGRKVAHVR